ARRPPAPAGSLGSSNSRRPSPRGPGTRSAARSAWTSSTPEWIRALEPTTSARSPVADAPRRVFITGALGFIGRVLAARYATGGAEVRGVDVRADPELGVVAGDVTEPGDWQAHAER